MSEEQDYIDQCVIFLFNRGLIQAETAWRLAISDSVHIITGAIKERLILLWATSFSSGEARSDSMVTGCWQRDADWQDYGKIMSLSQKNYVFLCCYNNNNYWLSWENRQDKKNGNWWPLMPCVKYLCDSCFIFFYSKLYCKLYCVVWSRVYH